MPFIVGRADVSNTARLSAPGPYAGVPACEGRSQMNEPDTSKSTRIQVAGLSIAAASLALALLRTAFDVMEVLGR